MRVGVAGENAVQVGQRLLSEFNGLVGLHRAPFVDLCNQRGIGATKAAQLKDAIELGGRMAREAPQGRSAINEPKDAANLVAYEMSALEQEHLRVILIDIRNHVLDIEEVYKGSTSSSQVRVGELFKAAIRCVASDIIVVHNHPGGDPTPSSDDKVVTCAIVQAGKLLDVDVLDHLIIGQGKDNWVSMKERGLGFA